MQKWLATHTLFAAVRPKIKSAGNDRITGTDSAPPPPRLRKLLATQQYPQRVSQPRGHRPAHHAKRIPVRCVEVAAQAASTANQRGHITKLPAATCSGFGLRPADVV